MCWCVCVCVHAHLRVRACVLWHTSAYCLRSLKWTSPDSLNSVAVPLPRMKLLHSMRPDFSGDQFCNTAVTLYGPVLCTLKAIFLSLYLLQSSCPHGLCTEFCSRKRRSHCWSMSFWTWSENKICNFGVWLPVPQRLGSLWFQNYAQAPVEILRTH